MAKRDRRPDIMKAAAMLDGVKGGKYLANQVRSLLTAYEALLRNHQQALEELRLRRDAERHRALRAERANQRRERRLEELELANQLEEEFSLTVPPPTVVKPIQ